MKCPQCQSTHLRKNGRLRGKQRYYCKDCGRQFVADAPVETLPGVQIDREPVSSNGRRELRLAEVPPPELAPVPAAAGIAILLLDAENLKFDENIEKFLTGFCDEILVKKLVFNCIKFTDNLLTQL